MRREGGRIEGSKGGGRREGGEGEEGEGREGAFLCGETVAIGIMFLNGAKKDVTASQCAAHPCCVSVSCSTLSLASPPRRLYATCAQSGCSAIWEEWTANLLRVKTLTSELLETIDEISCESKVEWLGLI